MRPFTGTLPFDAAYALVLGAARPTVRLEQIPVEQADGRVLATSIVADQDVPAFDRAAMDGYAVVSADTAGASDQSPVALRLAGRVLTGETSETPVVAGTCIEVATGAIAARSGCGGDGGTHDPGHGWTRVRAARGRASAACRSTRGRHS